MPSISQISYCSSSEPVQTVIEKDRHTPKNVLCRINLPTDKSRCVECGVFDGQVVYFEETRIFFPPQHQRQYGKGQECLLFAFLFVYLLRFTINCRRTA